MKRKSLIAVVLSALSILLIGCGSVSTTVADNGKINIVATIFPYYDFTRAVVGEKANLTMLISPGSSIHSYEPSPSDILKLRKADIFIYTGGESDAWVSTLLDSMDTSKMKIVCLADSVNTVEEETVEGMEPEADETGAQWQDISENHVFDEHIWTSPKNAVKLVKAVSDSVCERDTENAGFYQKNAEAYIHEIEKVDSEIAGIVKEAKRKKIVVADKFPFRYFVEEYGLEYCAAFSACSDQTDASASTIAYLVDTVTEEQIPFVYHVELSNQNVAKAISEQTGAGMLQLNSCHTVSKTEFDAGVTYISLMKQNAENLRKGLN